MACHLVLYSQYLHIFQKKTNRVTKPLSNECRDGLIERLPQFGAIPSALSSDLSERLLSVDVESLLKSKHFVVHKGCYDDYNKRQLERARSKRRKVSLEGQGSPDLIVRTRQQSSASSISLGEEVCMFCGERDMYDPKRPTSYKMKLQAAAGKKMSSQYVKDFTTKLRNMAAKLDDSRILSLLGHDVRATELYKHNPCYLSYLNRYILFGYYLYWLLYKFYLLYKFRCLYNIVKLAVSFY